jgi:K+-sensing histidine kinase KdpD
LNNGHLKLSRTDCDITELITEATSRWKTQNTAKPLHIETTITNPAFNVDKAQMRQIISHLLTFASIRVTEGTVLLSANDTGNTLNIKIQSNGQKARDKSEVDSSMIEFITTSLVKLHDGHMDDPHETDDGLLLSFSLPR